MTTVIDTKNPEVRTHLAAMQTAHALALEINSGMKISNRWSPLKNAKAMGFTGNRKPQALAFMVETYQLNASDSIVRALKKHGMEVVLTEAPA